MNFTKPPSSDEFGSADCLKVRTMSSHRDHRCVNIWNYGDACQFVQLPEATISLVWTGFQSARSIKSCCSNPWECTPVNIWQWWSTSGAPVQWATVRSESISHWQASAWTQDDRYIKNSIFPWRLIFYYPIGPQNEYVPLDMMLSYIFYFRCPGNICI